MSQLPKSILFMPETPQLSNFSSKSVEVSWLKFELALRANHLRKAHDMVYEFSGTVICDGVNRNVRKVAMRLLYSWALYFGNARIAEMACSFLFRFMDKDDYVLCIYSALLFLKESHYKYAKQGLYKLSMRSGQVPRAHFSGSLEKMIDILISMTNSKRKEFLSRLTVIQYEDEFDKEEM